MASNDYDIVNMALVRLGANTVTSLSDGSRNANAANEIFTMIRDDMLSMHPWNFATRRAWLDEVTPNTLSITSVTQANPGVVTYTGTDPNDGDKYEISSVVGMTELNGNQYVVQNVDGALNTFELMDENTTSNTAYSSGGTAEQVLPKSEDWSYIYDEPADCLRILEVNDDPNINWERTEYGMLCNEEDVDIVYISKITTVSLWPAHFNSALAARLAMELAIPITGSSSKFNSMSKLFPTVLRQALDIDSKEIKSTRTPHNRYADARR